MAPAPDAKARRYDRQLRIWGAEGQRRLESCRVALLNCGPTGSEALKNLVLGGIGSFTVVDGAKARAPPPACLARSRAAFAAAARAAPRLLPPSALLPPHARDLAASPRRRSRRATWATTSWSRRAGWGRRAPRW